jgi:hypothetical protein
VTVDELLEQLNSAELRHLTERQNMRRAIVQLHDALQESMSTHGRPAWFDKQVEAALTAARPHIDDTARQVRVGYLSNFRGKELRVEVFSNGQFCVGDRDHRLDNWNEAEWGWLS